MAVSLLAWVALLSLPLLGLTQDTTASGITTVTDTSTLAIVILPSTSDSTSDSTPVTTMITTTTSTTPSISVVALPTTVYTGQPILVGTCNIPQYTPIHFNDGGQLEVPLVGCSDDRPECCPSPSGLNRTLSPTPTSTSAASDTGAGIQFPTGVVSLYSAHPLTVCPKDFTDIDPVCCPSGYTLFGQALLGKQTPCVSDLTTTISVPSNVLASISSYVASTALATAEALTTTTASASVDVIVNQVFALGLPCANDEESGHKGGLSVGAKAGIGAGTGVGALCLLLLLWWACAGRKSRREKRAQKNLGMIAGPSERVGYTDAPTPVPNMPEMHAPGQNRGAYYDQAQRQQNGYCAPAPTKEPEYKHSSPMSSRVSGAVSPPLPGSPPQQSHSLDQGGIAGDYAQGYMHGVHSAIMIQNQQQQRDSGHRSPGPPGYESELAHKRSTWGTGRQQSGPPEELDGEGVRRY